MSGWPHDLNAAPVSLTQNFLEVSAAVHPDGNPSWKTGQTRRNPVGAAERGAGGRLEARLLLVRGVCALRYREARLTTMADDFADQRSMVLPVSNCYSRPVVLHGAKGEFRVPGWKRYDEAPRGRQAGTPDPR